MIFIYQFLVYFCTLPLMNVYSSESKGTLMNSGELVVQFDSPTVFAPFQCQMCYDYYLDADSESGWWFRYAYGGILELDSEGIGCCAEGESTIEAHCSPSCTGYAIEYYQPNLFIEFNPQDPTVVLFSGIYNSLAQTNSESSCSPPGSPGDICANFEFTYTLMIEAESVKVADGVFVDVPSNSIRNHIHIDTWPFLQGSEGLRIPISIGADGNVETQAFRFFPENEPAGNTPQIGGFNAIGIETTSRIANVTFSQVCRLNGSTEGTPIILSGPYPNQVDLNLAYFYVQVPPFSSVDYDLFTTILPINLSEAITITSSFLMTTVIVFVFFL
jgi:hypothetical protein